MTDYRYTKDDRPQARAPAPRRTRSLFYGRHFVWLARLMVKIAKELALTNDQFLRMLELVITDIKRDSPNFNRNMFEEQVRAAAYAAKHPELEV